MIFEKYFAVRKEKARRANETKNRIAKQKAELNDKVPFDAKITQTLKIADMLLLKVKDIDCVTVETDERSEALVDEKLETELTDYIIKKHENNSKQYDIKFKEFDI